MAQDFPPNHGRRDPRDDTGEHRDASHRWPAEAPNAAIAQVVLALDEAITLKRRAAAAWLTAHGDVLPALPIKPSRMELAVFMALAETYGAALVDAPRFLPVLDFIADCGAVKLVQRVMYGETRATEGAMTWVQSENERFAGLLRDARVPFEFLCGTWPEIFMAQAHATLAAIGVQVRPSDPGSSPSSNDDDREDDDG